MENRIKNLHPIENTEKDALGVEIEKALAERILHEGLESTLCMVQAELRGKNYSPVTDYLIDFILRHKVEEVQN